MNLPQDRAEPEQRSRAAFAHERPETSRPPSHVSEAPPDEEAMDGLDVDIDALLPVAMGAGNERVVIGPDLAELLRAAEERLDARGPLSQQRTDAGDDVADVPVPEDVLRLLAEPLESDDEDGGTGALLGSSAGGTGADRPATMDGHVGTAHGQEDDLEEVLPRASDPPKELTVARGITGVSREPPAADPPRLGAVTRPGFTDEPPARSQTGVPHPLDEPRLRERADVATPVAPMSAISRGFGDRSPAIDRGAALIERAAMAQRAEVPSRKPATERPLASDRGGMDRGVSDRGGGMDRGVSDRGGGMDRGVSDRGGGIDRGMSDRGAMDRGVSDRGAMDRGVSDRGGMDRGGMDRGGMDRGGMDRGGMEHERSFSMDRGAMTDRGGGADRGGGVDRGGGADRGSPRAADRGPGVDAARWQASKMVSPAAIEVAESGPKSRAARTDAMPAVLGPGDAARALGRAIANRVSGAIVITQGDEHRRVVLHDGDVVTAGSSAPTESLVAFLSARGDIERELVPRLAGKLPAFGRHAGAALVAHGHLGQDDLWPALRAHAEWVIGRALLVESGTCEIELDPPARYKAEPSVFGGATGAEVLVEAVQRAVAPEAALARLGGYGARIAPGVRPALLAECALTGEEEDAVRAAPGRTIHEFAGDGPTERWSMLYALVCLDVIDVLPAVSAQQKQQRAESQRADPLDEEALRARVRARLALVEEGDYFALLGVPRGATSYEIRRAYLDLRRAFEPSRILTAGTVDLVDDVRLVVEVVEEAYEVLRDSHRRERYRRAIEAGPPR